MDRATKKLIQYRVESGRGSGKVIKLAQQLMEIFKARLGGTYTVRLETKERTIFSNSCEIIGDKTLRFVSQDGLEHDVDLINIRSFRFYENLEA